MQLWGNMGNMARGVVIILFIMSIWSLAVIIDRALYFSAARKQSREFAPQRCRRSEGRPSGRGDQGCRPLEEVAPR